MLLTEEYKSNTFPYIDLCQDCQGTLKEIDRIAVYTSFGLLIGIIYECGECKERVIIQTLRQSKDLII